jgi:hypothetical protein
MQARAALPSRFFAHADALENIRFLALFVNGDKEEPAIAAAADAGEAGWNSLHFFSLSKKDIK